jgi:hypothetical protein
MGASSWRVCGCLVNKNKNKIKITKGKNKANHKSKSDKNERTRVNQATTEATPLRPPEKTAPSDLNLFIRRKGERAGSARCNSSSKRENQEQEERTRAKKNRTNKNQNTAHNGQTHVLKETAKMISREKLRKVRLGPTCQGRARACANSKLGSFSIP